MKNKFGVFLIYFFEIVLIVGCSQAQTTMIATVIPKQTNTPLPVATLTSPTVTPLPTFTPFPTMPPPILPKGIFNPFQESIYEPTWIQKSTHEIIKTTFGFVLSDSVIEEKVLVDSSMGNVVFSVFCEEGDLDLTLIQPDGSVIDPSMAESVGDFYSPIATSNHIAFISNSFSEKYYFIAPQPGTWVIRIFGKSTPVTGSNYMVQVTSMPATSFSKHFDKDEYVSGDVIKLSASIEDGVSGSLLTPPEYVYGVSMKIIVEDPAKKQYSFELYDDGLHGDGESNDGVYANDFSNTLLAGKYNFYLQISGKNNRAKEPFTREYSFSTVVK
jgi:hypothetical protein